MENVVTSNANVMHGVACFAGASVPVKSLFDHLEDGHNLDYFLEQFPSVKREQVLALLEDSRARTENVSGFG
jgi:uncharacterized protein (DUF433 family)